MASIRQLRPSPSARATSSVINGAPRHGSELDSLCRLSHGHHNCHWRNKLFVLTALVTPLPFPSLATLRRINKNNDIGPARAARGLAGHGRGERENNTTS